jgi:hypothetical protein
MAHFRYFILSLDGTEPSGTNDLEVARNVATQLGYSTWVIDAQEGVTVEASSEDGTEIEPFDAVDYGLNDYSGPEEGEED